MNRKERRALERQKISSFDGEVKKEEYKPKKNYTRYVIISLVIIIFIGAIFVSYLKGKKPGELDDFVACLADKDVKFYGSFQCSHCQEQENDFAESSKLLESSGVYVECGPLGSFNSLCTSEGVRSVPHWVIADEVLSGRQDLQILAEKSGCSLPNETD